MEPLWVFSLMEWVFSPSGPRWAQAVYPGVSLSAGMALALSTASRVWMSMGGAHLHTDRSVWE